MGKSEENKQLVKHINRRLKHLDICTVIAEEAIGEDRQARHHAAGVGPWRNASIILFRQDWRETVLKQSTHTKPVCKVRNYVSRIEVEYIHRMNCPLELQLPFAVETWNRV